MANEHIEFSQLQGLLRRRADDAAVVALTEKDPSAIERSGHMGFVELMPGGISIAFKEANWLVPAAEITEPSELRVSAVHLHGEGHDDYSQYQGRLPKDIRFGDPEAGILRKLGDPETTGGGGVSRVVKQRIPHWLCYSLGGDRLHIQFDDSDRVDLVTIYAPDFTAPSGRP